jgi:hypothetical protein
MRKYTVLYVAILIVVSSPAQAQNPVNKVSILQTVTLSGSLIKCGYTKIGSNIGLAASKLFPRVSLTDKSPEVINAFLKGESVIKNNVVTCSDIVSYARRIGLMR